MYLADSHVHSEYSFDAAKDGSASVDAICASAVYRGMSRICFTDHFDFADEIYLDKTDFDIDAAYRDVCAAREKYMGKLSIGFGAELGEPLEGGEEAERIAADGRFDFILGSLHNLRKAPDFYYLKFELLPRKILDGYVDSYFEQIMKTLSFGGMQSLAHLTYIGRYIAAAKIDYDYSRCREAVNAIFTQMTEKGIALEMNISTLIKGQAEPMPTRGMLRDYRARGGELITVGTDAHSADNVGLLIREAYEFLASAGFEHICVFENKKCVMHPIA